MNPVVSIDLGAAYTKLALRRRPSSHTELLAHETLHLDEQHICIPSIAAWRGQSNDWAFGVDAVDLQDGNGVHVYRNWKPLLFQHEASTIVRESFFSPADAPTVQEMATHYFRWLRQSFLPETLGLPIEGDVTARMCVPDFAIGTPEASQFEAILKQAGWATQTVFCISEPLASLTGALSQGKNSLDLDDSGRPSPRIMDIFADTEFVNFMRTEPGGSSDYRVLVIDIGAYTADFGLVELAPDTQDYFSHCRTHSVPLGILTLDERVCRDLSEEKARAIKRLSPTDRERMRQVIYGIGVPWRLTTDLTIGGNSETKLVAHCVEEQAKAIGNAVDVFLDKEQISRVHEVVLSGGGNGIPRIVNHLIQRLSQREVLGFHLSVPDDNAGGARTFPISQQVVRGASAIGGASVLFDE